MKSGNILVVYKNYDLIKKFANELRKNDYQIKLYINPYDVLLEYKPNYYDLLLFETRLTELSGFELYSILKKIDNVPACFITYLTSYYLGLIELYPDLDVNCFISPHLAEFKFIEIIKTKIKMQK